MPSSASAARRLSLRLSYNPAIVTVESPPSIARYSCVWPRLSRGGLSGWQQKIVTDYIEANLAEAVRLADMAQLVRLSPFHFARAFKQSFGVPPHRYHVGRRIARAKDMLADRDHSITAIARELGFAETSSFSSTFRRVTGTSPSDFRRERV
jgi:AraC family transcriptional regulator